MSNKWRVIWKIDNDTYDFLVAFYIKDGGGYSVVAETCSRHEVHNRCHPGGLHGQFYHPSSHIRRHRMSLKIQELVMKKSSL